MIRQLTTPAELKQYDTFVKTHPQGNLWQSLEWKTYQEALDRETRIYAAFDGKNIIASALVVIDSTAFGLSTWDIQRGPLVIENGQLKIENFLTRIIQDARQSRCMSLFFSPQQPFSMFNFQFSIRTSARHEQPEATRILDLTLDDDDLLAQMHQKGRYNIKVAEKNGVNVTQSNDIDAYYDLAEKTGGRDGFGIPSKKQLTAFLKELPESFLLLARTAQSPKPIAGLIGINWEKTGIYYYGASDYEHRALMAPYLLQWEAIKLCKAAGCTTYDLLGIAPPITNHQSPETTHDPKPMTHDPNHAWSGISSFKEKFGGTVVTYPPEQEIVLKPLVKTLLKLKRKIMR